MITGNGRDVLVGTIVTAALAFGIFLFLPSLRHSVNNDYSGVRMIPSRPAGAERPPEKNHDTKTQQDQVPTQVLNFALDFARQRFDFSNAHAHTYSTEIELMSKSIIVPQVVESEILNKNTRTMERKQRVKFRPQQSSFAINTDHRFHLAMDVENNENVTIRRKFRIVVSVDSKSFIGVTTFFEEEKQKLQKPSSTNSHEKLIVLSANIFNYNYWDMRRTMIKDFLDSIDFDVVAFQEVRARKISDSSQSRYQIAELAEMLPGFEFVFKPAMTFEETSTTPHEIVHEGLALFSRLPILSHFSQQLSQDPNDSNDFHQRILLGVLVDSPIGPVQVCTTHLSLSSRARAKTLLEIGEALDDTQPVIVMGDFNDELTNNTNVLVEKFNFQDAWLNSHTRRETDNKEGFTFNSWDLKSRIDYIFSRQLRQDSIEIVGTKPQISKGLKPQAGVRDTHDRLHLSDHFFLRAEFEAL